MSTATIAPTLGTIKRHTGIAGQIAYTVTVAYPGEDSAPVTFTGNTDGGPVVMVTPSTPGGTFVYDPQRFGRFSAEWVRRFFGITPA